jgi:hypothetical protein
VVIVRFIDTGPDWLEPLVVEISDLEVMADLAPGLLGWDPEPDPVS